MYGCYRMYDIIYKHIITVIFQKLISLIRIVAVKVFKRYKWLQFFKKFELAKSEQSTKCISHIILYRWLGNSFELSKLILQASELPRFTILLISVTKLCNSTFFYDVHRYFYDLLYYILLGLAMIGAKEWFEHRRKRNKL